MGFIYMTPYEGILLIQLVLAVVVGPLWSRIHPAWLAEAHRQFPILIEKVGPAKVSAFPVENISVFDIANKNYGVASKFYRSPFLFSDFSFRQSNFYGVGERTVWKYRPSMGNPGFGGIHRRSINDGFVNAFYFRR